MVCSHTTQERSSTIVPTIVLAQSIRFCPTFLHLKISNLDSTCRTDSHQYTLCELGSVNLRSLLYPPHPHQSLSSLVETLCLRRYCIDSSSSFIFLRGTRSSSSINESPKYRSTYFDRRDPRRFLLHSTALLHLVVPSNCIFFQTHLHFLYSKKYWSHRSKPARADAVEDLEISQ